MKKFFSICAAVILIVVNIMCINADTVLTKNQTIEYLDSIASYELKTVKNPDYGSIGGEWLVMGLARYGTIKENYLSAYKSNLISHLKSCNGVLSEKKYSEYARVVIALTAIEENPETFGGYNLLKPLAEFENLESQSPNSIVYTLIALDCGEYDVPEPDKSYTGKKTTRERLINTILKNQLEDGGWSLIGTKSDADMTAMAMQALAPYYKKEDEAKKAINKGITRLSQLQQKDGDYNTGNFSNCESTAQVLATMSTLNINMNDSRFIKNGNTVIDGLLKYYNNGAFCHLENGMDSQMATEQAMYALTAYYRKISGMNGLYEMKDGISKRILNMNEENKQSGVSETKKSISKSKNKESDKNNKKVANDKKQKVEDLVKNEQIQTKQYASDKKLKNDETTGQDKKGKDLKISESVSCQESVAVAEEHYSDEKGNADDENCIAPAVVIATIVILGITGVIIYKKVKK